LCSDLVEQGNKFAVFHARELHAAGRRHNLLGERGVDTALQLNLGRIAAAEILDDGCLLGNGARDACLEGAVDVFADAACAGLGRLCQEPAVAEVFVRHGHAGLAHFTEHGGRVRA